MCKSMYVMAGFAALSALATTAPAHAGGKRIRVDNVTPPPVVNVTPTYSRLGKPAPTTDVSNAPGGVAVHVRRRGW